MGNSRFLWDNKFDNYTTTANSENSSYPVTNLQDSRLSRRWRTSSQLDYISYGDCESTNSPTLDDGYSGLADGTWARSAAQANGGTYSWLLSKTSAAAAGDALVYLTDNTDTDDLHGLGAGDSYRLAVSVYTDVATAANAKIIIQEYHTAAWNDTLTLSATTTGAWEDLSGSFTVTADTTAVSIRVEIDTSEVSGKLLYIDDISVYAENRVVFDAGSGMTFAPDAIGIVQHNISDTAVIRLQANATDSWGSPSYDTTITQTDDAIVAFYSGLTEYRYWSISIDDFDNTDDYIEIGRIFGGPYLDMGTAARMAWTGGLDDSSKAWTSDSGQSYGEVRIVTKDNKYDFAFITSAIRILHEAMYNTIAMVIPIIFVLESDLMTAYPPVYGRIKKEPKYKHIFTDKYNITTNIVEVK